MKFILLFLFPLLLHAAGMPQEFREKLRADGVDEREVSVFAQEVGEKTPLLEENADRPMNPASVMKLVTTYSALEILGPDYKWKTEAYLDGRLQNGVLHGNLALKGYGDPKLTLENFWLLLRELRARGLRKIEGDLILDRSFFSLAATDPGSFDGKPWRPYNVIPDALLLNFEATTLHFVPQNGKVEVLLDPDLGNLSLDNRLRPGKGDCRFWEDGFDEAIEGDGSHAKLTLSGEYPLACGEKSDAISALDHSVYFFRLFQTLWRELGGEISGKVREAQVPGEATLFYSFASPPLASIIVDINKYSNNVMARQLFLTLGEGKTEAAAVAVKNWLAANGLDFPELVLENGCGLSRAERISARHLGALLLRAHRSPFMPEWVSSLPIVGLDGTMKKRLAGKPAAGHAHIKTGYLEGVRAVAGFVEEKSGKTLVLVAIVNGPGAKAARGALDVLLEWAATSN